jgi:hypothetical protein
MQNGDVHDGAGFGAEVGAGQPAPFTQSVGGMKIEDQPLMENLFPE